MTTTEQAVAIALVALNLPSFIGFAADKWKAGRGAWRIPEATLIGLGWLGPLGAWLGVYGLRHKTRKGWFLLRLALVTLVSPAAWAAAWLAHTHAGR